MIADDVEAGRGDERGEFRDQFQQVEDDVGGLIRPGALEAVGEPAVEPLREMFDGQAESNEAGTRAPYLRCGLRAESM